MRRITMSALMLGGAMLFASCKKNHSAQPLAPLSATIDGKDYAFTQVSVGSDHVDDDNPQDLLLTLTGVDAAAEILGIEVEFPDGQLKTGTFPFSADGQNSLGWMVSGDVYSSGMDSQPQGSIVITQISAHQIEGTFQGSVYDPNSQTTKIISNGRFSVKH